MIVNARAEPGFITPLGWKVAGTGAGSYNQNLWIGDLIGGAAYLPR